jgi:hypothetical protein
MNDRDEWRAAVRADRRLAATCTSHHMIRDNRGGQTCSNCGLHVTGEEA